MHPFALVDQQRDFIDAFQEHINAQVRTGESQGPSARSLHRRESRHRSLQGRCVQRSGHELKERLLGVILNEDVKSRDELRTVLERFGEVRERTRASRMPT